MGILAAKMPMGRNINNRLLLPSSIFQAINLPNPFHNAASIHYRRHDCLCCYRIIRCERLNLCVFSFLRGQEATLSWFCKITGQALTDDANQVG